MDNLPGILLSAIIFIFALAGIQQKAIDIKPMPIWAGIAIIAVLVFRIVLDVLLWRRKRLTKKEEDN